MIDLIGNANWQKFKDTVNNMHATFNQQAITWHRSKGGIDRYAEDNLAELFTDVQILGLVGYNDFRTWPLDEDTKAGMLDKENCTLYLNYEYLRTNGWVNTNGNFDYKPDHDRFTIKGISYVPTNFTDTVQAKDNALLVMVVLEREKINTTENPV